MFVRQYSDATSSWIAAVRGNTKPVATPGSVNCAGVSAWVNSVAVSPAQPRQRRPVLIMPYFSTRVVARSPTSEYLQNLLEHLSRSDTEYLSSDDLFTANQWGQNETPGGKPFSSPLLEDNGMMMSHTIRFERPFWCLAKRRCMHLLK